MGIKLCDVQVWRGNKIVARKFHEIVTQESRKTHGPTSLLQCFQLPCQLCYQSIQINNLFDSSFCEIK